MPCRADEWAFRPSAFTDDSSRAGDGSAMAHASGRTRAVDRGPPLRQRDRVVSVDFEPHLEGARPGVARAWHDPGVDGERLRAPWGDQEAHARPDGGQTEPLPDGRPERDHRARVRRLLAEPADPLASRARLHLDAYRLREREERSFVSGCFARCGSGRGRRPGRAGGDARRAHIVVRRFHCEVARRRRPGVRAQRVLALTPSVEGLGFCPRVERLVVRGGGAPRFGRQGVCRERKPTAGWWVAAGFFLADGVGFEGQPGSARALRVVVCRPRTPRAGAALRGITACESGPPFAFSHC